MLLTRLRLKSNEIVFDSKREFVIYLFRSEHALNFIANIHVFFRFSHTYTNAPFLNIVNRCIIDQSGIACTLITLLLRNITRSAQNMHYTTFQHWFRFDSLEKAFRLFYQTLLLHRPDICLMWVETWVPAQYMKISHTIVWNMQSARVYVIFEWINVEKKK